MTSSTDESLGDDSLSGESSGTKTRGFTLSELLTVVGILGILSAIAVPQFQNCLIRAHLASFQAKTYTITQAHAQFAIDTGVIPEDVVCPAWKPCRNCVREIPDETDADFFFRCTIGKKLNKDDFIDPFPNIDLNPNPIIAVLKNELNHYVPFEGGESSGCTLVSLGPDGRVSEYSKAFGFQGLPYDSTNGLRSAGDVFYIIPESTPARFRLASTPTPVFPQQ